MGRLVARDKLSVLLLVASVALAVLFFSLLS